MQRGISALPEMAYSLANGTPSPGGEVRRARLPLMHQHINVLGHSACAVLEAVPHGALQPLRDPTTIDELDGL